MSEPRLNLQRTSSTVLAVLFAGSLVMFTSAQTLAADHAVDWDEVDGRSIPMFQPGQGSWEWLLIPANHGAGARRMREGRTCLSCHEGEERTIGQRIGSGQVLEPEPMEGMPGTIDVDLKVTRDDDDLHLRLSWAALTAAPRAGDAEVPARVTLMLGSEALSVASIAACWASCHSDLQGMSDPHAEQLTKYLPNSRTRMTATGGGDDLRTDAQLVEELAAGRYLEYWQAKLDENGVHEQVDGYFLDERHKNDSPEFTAHARRDGDQWVVEMSRPLESPGGPRLTIEPGVSYTLAIAVHDNYATHRHHYVSFPLQMVLDSGEADLIVTRR
jgi:hypothetical protein